MAKPMKPNGRTSPATTSHKHVDLEYHPLANLFPLLGETELQTLSDDIRDNGLNVPITMYEGKILDGRNRHAACILAGVAPAFTDFEGHDPVTFVVSTNLHRRHLTTGQRAMIAEALANLQEGRPRKTPKNLGVSQTEAAKMLNVSHTSVEQARNGR